MAHITISVNKIKRENFSEFSLFFLLSLRRFKAVNEAVHICGANVAANDLIFVNEKAEINGAVVLGIIFNLICITGDGFTLIFGEIQTLLLLHFVITEIDVVERFGHADLDRLQGSFRYLPTELLDESDAIAVLVYFDVRDIGNDGLAILGVIGRNESDERDEHNE